MDDRRASRAGRVPVPLPHEHRDDFGYGTRMTVSTFSCVADRAPTSRFVADSARRGLFGVHTGRLPPVCTVFPRRDAVPAPHLARVAADAARQRRAATRARHAAHLFLCVPVAPEVDAAANQCLTVRRPVLACNNGELRRRHADWHHHVLRGQRRSRALDRGRNALVLASSDCAQRLRQRPAPSVAVRSARVKPVGRSD